MMNPSRAFAAGNKKTLNIKSDPPRALVSLRRISDGKKISQCRTPCKIKVKSKHSYRLSYIKSGYIGPTIYLDDMNKWSLVDDVTMELTLNRTKSTRQIEVCKTARQESGAEDHSSKLCWAQPPNYPLKVKFGGQCKFSYDVTANGETKNVKTISCTDDIFEDNALLSVRKSEFVPKRVNNQFVPDLGKEITITFANRN